MDKSFFPPTGKQVVPLSKLEGDDELTIVAQPNLLKRALRICVKNKRASIAVLQRGFDIGYEDAVKLLDRMTEQGWIGEANGSRPRPILNRAFEMIALWNTQENAKWANKSIYMESEDDELLEAALRICVKKGSASIPILQHRLRIPYERVGTILKVLERAGFIGKTNGAQPRRVCGIAYATVLRWDKTK